MLKDYLPLPTAPVAVIGAGVAGLVTAHRLVQQGVAVDVLEASSRLGGRVWTERFDPGDADPGRSDSPAAFAEFGAMRIPEAHTLTVDYLRRLGLAGRLRRFKTVLSEETNLALVGERTVLPVGAALDAVSEELASRPGAPTASRRTLRSLAWLTMLVDSVAPAEIRHQLALDLPQLTRVVDAGSLGAPAIDADVHRSAQAGRDLETALRDIPDFRASCGARLRSFIDDVVTETGTGLLCVQGGTAVFTEELTRTLPVASVRRRHRVLRIKTADSGCELHVCTPLGDVVCRYPFVVCTIPFSVLRRMPVAGIEPDKRQVIDAMDYGSATKVAILCRRPFWTDHQIHGGGSSVGGMARQLYYPSDTDPSRPAALLASYTIGEDAEVLGRLQLRDRHAAVLADAIRVHPELAEPGMVLDIRSMVWEMHPYSRGCSSRTWGMSDAERDAQLELAQRHQHGLHFAGEHCSTTPAWINGAVESGVRVVDELAGCW